MRIAVGILMLETGFPRVTGDIGNAGTFPFPVRYKVVKGVPPPRVMAESDDSILYDFIVAGNALIEEGVKVLVTSCGFLAKFQRELGRAFTVPVYTSSLVQIPLVHTVTGRRVGVLTADESGLSRRHFESVGAGDVPVSIEGIRGTYFWEVLVHDVKELDVGRAEQDVVGAARKLHQRNRDMGAIVLECTNFPPFARSIQREVGLPVFDMVTLTNMAYETVNRRIY